MAHPRRRPPGTNDPRELEAWRRGQDDDNFDKIDKVPSAEDGNIPVFDNEGGLKDSGIGIDEVSLKVVDGVEDNILVLDADGDMKDSGDSIGNIENRSNRRSFFFARNY